MKQNIWFIVVTYKPDIKLLESMTSTLPADNLIIIDNSPDLMPVYSFTTVQKVFRASGNLGYGGGANVGIQRALKRGAEWVVILNQDLRFSKKAIEEFCFKLQSFDPCIAGPFTGDLDVKRWTTIFPSLNDTKIDYISGSFLAIHRDIIKEVGFFYEPYFMYYEDVDYCIAAKNKGFMMHKIHINDIYHGDEPSLGKNSFLHQYYLARNHLLFVERQAPLKVKLREYLRLPKTLFDHYQKGETGAMVGIRDYLLRRFGQYKPL